MLDLLTVFEHANLTKLAIQHQKKTLRQSEGRAVGRLFGHFRDNSLLAFGYNFCRIPSKVTKLFKFVFFSNIFWRSLVSIQLTTQNNYFFFISNKIKSKVIRRWFVLIKSCISLKLVRQKLRQIKKRRDKQKMRGK